MSAKAPGAECARCPGRDRAFVAPEPAAKPIRLAIVGEGPGRTEVEESRPFVGASGRMLMRGLRTIGLNRGDVHWTNAVLCDVPLKQLPDARKCCAERLRRELEAAAPPVVMPVGAIGARSALRATKSTPILKWRGSVSRVNYGTSAQAEQPSQNSAAVAADRAVSAAWVLPTIHPAFVMRARQWGWVLERDLERVGRVMREGFVPPEDAPGRRTIIARNDAALSEGLVALERAQYIGFDVETVGLGPTGTALVCFGLSDGTTTVVIPWSTRSDGAIPWWPNAHRVAARVSALWAQRCVVTHNGPAFDHIVAARYGLHIAAWDDTLLAAHASHPELPKNLAHVVTMGLDVPPWKQWEDRGASLDRLWIYNARDTLYMTLRWAQIRDELGLGPNDPMPWIPKSGSKPQRIAA